MKKINRLNKQRVYLAGAIDRVADRGVGWRQKITPFLRKIGVEVYDPIKKPTKIGVEDENTHLLKIKLKSERDFDEISKIMKQIRKVDLRLVDTSDFLVVSLDLNIHPCGTYEEIFWANRQKKPIIVCVDQGKEHAPDWLFGTIPHQMIFSNWKEVKNYINYINSCRQIEFLDRWQFFSH